MADDTPAPNLEEQDPTHLRADDNLYPLPTSYTFADEAAIERHFGQSLRSLVGLPATMLMVAVWKGSKIAGAPLTWEQVEQIQEVEAVTVPTVTATETGAAGVVEDVPGSSSETPAGFSGDPSTLASTGSFPGSSTS
ncbi:MAG: hypothetical protein FJ033_10910 [Chloroflexi bacterium]|nr:hypothetical protein [Chloroflexota bacterium]